MKYTIKEILDTRLKHLSKECPENITDLVFLEIEENYLPTYQSSVKLRGTNTVNKLIGKFIREHWDLKNLGRCTNPKSKLISSYERHSN